MINRYLGTKTSLIDPIMRRVRARTSPGDLICDVFAGTLAVSIAAKKAGLRVACNDINHFSYIYGTALIESCTVPSVNLDALLPLRRASSLRSDAVVEVGQMRTKPEWSFLTHSESAAKFAELIGVLNHLMDPLASVVPGRLRRTDFFDAYCEMGTHSRFESLRGATGNRRFFTPENAAHMDSALSQLRLWNQRGTLGRDALSLLLCSLLEAVERVSNTQGTYHDFPRDTWDPRAFKPLALRPVSLQGLLGGPGDHLVGTSEDSLEWISKVPPHKVLYIDPPYNFRQYTSYYFMLNLIARYPDLADPDEYFRDIEYVRGQNMADDFTSTFSKAKQFIPSLRDLIRRARADTVILSYFSGRNHWNAFDSEDNGQGLALLEELFEGPEFRKGSAKIYPIPRTNYQSYGGYKAQIVDEYLLIARKRLDQVGA